MKKTITTIVLGWALAMILAAPAAHGQSKRGSSSKSAAPKTVTEHFLKIPAKYLPILERIPNRRSLIEIEDIANGYLRLGSADWEGWGEVALFKRSNGTYLVAVNEYERATICDGGLIFLELKNGKWREVEPLPRYSYGDLLTAFHGATGRQPEDEEMDERIFELPRQGKEITLKIGDVPVMGFLWEGAEFVSGMVYLRDGVVEENQDDE